MTQSGTQGIPAQKNKHIIKISIMKVKQHQKRDQGGCGMSIPGDISKSITRQYHQQAPLTLPTLSTILRSGPQELNKPLKKILKTGKK